MSIGLPSSSSDDAAVGEVMSPDVEIFFCCCFFFGGDDDANAERCIVSLSSGCFRFLLFDDSVGSFSGPLGLAFGFFGLETSSLAFALLPFDVAELFVAEALFSSAKSSSRVCLDLLLVVVGMITIVVGSPALCEKASAGFITIKEL